MLSESTTTDDEVVKRDLYQRLGVPHYWIADPVERLLEVYRRTDIAYALVVTAKRGQTVRAMRRTPLSVCRLAARLRRALVPSPRRSLAAKRSPATRYHLPPDRVDWSVM